MFNAGREVEWDDVRDNVELLRYIIRELRDGVRERGEMIGKLQEIIKRQQETLKLHGLEEQV